MLWTLALALRLFQEDAAAPPPASSSSALGEMIHNSGPMAITVLLVGGVIGGRVRSLWW